MGARELKQVSQQASLTYLICLRDVSVKTYIAMRSACLRVALLAQGARVVPSEEEDCFSSISPLMSQDQTPRLSITAKAYGRFVP